MLALMIVPMVALGASETEDAGRADDSAQQQERSVDEIVVTGSRISRENADTTAPIFVLDANSIENSGLVSINDALLRNPAIGVGVSLQNVSNAREDTGANFVNLRGLGTQRSLTVINGKRRVPGTTNSSAVDLAAIPPSMIERIEILTGGTGAVYGADAVSGVTNVILKTDFEGIRLSAAAGVPQQGGGGDSHQMAIHAGTALADGRSKVGLAISYDRSGQLDGLDRSFSRAGRPSQFRPNLLNDSGSDGIPDNIVLNSPVVVFSFPESGGFGLPRVDADGNFLNVDNEIITYDPVTGVASDPFVFDYFTADPELRLIVNDVTQRCTLQYAIRCNGGGTSLGTVGGFNDVLGSGGDGFNFSKYNTLRAGFDRTSALLLADYSITEDIRVYLQTELSNNKSVAAFQAPFNVATETGAFAFITLSRDNPLLPGSVTDLMDERGLQSLDRVNRTHDDLGRRTTTTQRQTYSTIVGVEGLIFSDYDWEVFLQFGRTNNETRQSNVIYHQRLVQAFDAILDPLSGAVVCRDISARDAGCLPLRALGRNDPSLDANSPLNDPQFRQWLYYDPVTKSKVDQLLTGAQLTGDVLQLPSGPASVAFGFEYRNESIQFRDDEVRRSGQLLLQPPAVDSIHEDLAVWEVYAESLMPILVNAPLAQRLDVEAAIRHSNYTTVGDTLAWKLGTSWAPTESLRVRVTRSKSVRAPTITNLFSPLTSSFLVLTDPCSMPNLDSGSPFRRANCTNLGIPENFVDPAIIFKESRSGGNTNLESESSSSTTIGVVVDPLAVPGLSLSIDYWQIDLDGAISEFVAQDIVNNCVDLQSTDNTFCPIIVRGADFEIDRVDNFLLNIGRLTAKGTDFQINFKGALSQVMHGARGTIQVGIIGTFLDELDSSVGSLDPEKLTTSAGEQLTPNWRINAHLKYSVDSWSFSWFANYIGSANTDNQPPSAETYLALSKIPSQTYHNFAVNRRFDDQYLLRVGINNVFAAPPPAHPATDLGGGGLFDNNGRFFFVSGSLQFM